MIDTLAIDIGGTKIDAARVDGDGRILERYRLPTQGANAEELFDGLVALVEPLLAGGTLGGCGVGCGGPMTSGGEEVSPLNIPQWRSFPLRARLAERLRTRQVVVSLRGNAIRVAPYLYNDASDTDALLDALD